MTKPSSIKREPPTTLPQALAEIDVLNRRIQRERLARKAAEEMAENAMRSAIEDPLTKLANRTLINDQLRVEIDIAKRCQRKILVLYLDLDRFKAVNDTFGHETGDALLCHVAQVLKRAMRPEDIVGRLGGDEFVVITAHVTENNAHTFIERLQSTLRDSPLQINGTTLPLHASIGAASVDGDTDADEALHRADTAMYQAKKHTASGCCLFSDQLALEDRSRRQTLLALPQALNNRELITYYQPIINIHTGKIDQIEALLHWQCGGKLLHPNSFTSIAEESDFIVDFGQFTLEQCLKDIASWKKIAPPKQPPDIAINISSKQLLYPQFSSNLAQLIKQYKLNPSALHLEITEAILLKDDDCIIENLRHLANAGHKLTLDNFGSTYTSLAALRLLPFDTIKIDSSFINESLNCQCDQAIVRAMNMLSHMLGAKTTAEGIETEEQLQTAITLGCDYAQGDALSKAYTSEQVEKIFRQRFDMPLEQQERQRAVR